MAPRKRIKPSELVLPCEWSDCTFVGKCMEEFCDHVARHLREHLNDSQEKLEQYQCLWRSCEFCAAGPNELIIHVNFHSYHTKLKYLGSQMRAYHQDLPECSQRNHSQNMVPEIADTFVCCWEHCDMTINNPEWFYQHVTMHAYCAENESLLNNRKAIFCRWKDCDGTCKSRHKLREHLRTHTQEKVVACPSCGVMFSNNTKFFDHAKRQISEDKQIFICQYCSKHFASERLLRDHVRIHVRHLNCPFCDMVCTNFSSLKTHIRFRHCDERPFLCDFCDSSFKNTYDLRKHIETHNDSSAYCCDVNGCDFTARTLQTFRQHYKRVHESNGTIKYKCHICQKCFSWCYTLTLHLRKMHQLTCHSRFRYKEDEDGYWTLNIDNFKTSMELNYDFVCKKPPQKTSRRQNCTRNNSNASSKGFSTGLHASQFQPLSGSPVEKSMSEVDASLKEPVYYELQSVPLSFESPPNDFNETVALNAMVK
ncbi:histone H4 transcription factor-like [Phascolarctos cinereus]|uniref:Histone H4 transcription factor-like isoform X1 n=1 Tax=Phascolarctos cinereus TaxID=38626 RepID=A0A6P5JLI0_PHACI|nr:histone H4 transcription factor-like isoform X1 [Phascolarctos cinereus]XP_020831931.1 histone H4 transcription factor-like isoform X1 [Phascolarctos cinereus]XP_020831932.1 histone H4 transcription factor-like isoform X1 [Phascolarctos cinereus]XP_020831933.1 histone H4 transcription factor-like isoform X1 [Phascolarctos cinereus]XP_020831934.1 histone H4 transcription factor-like isoform X1 [Phascolarctos cinereus]